jgi:hypothetical protein
MVEQAIFGHLSARRRVALGRERLHHSNLNDSLARMRVWLSPSTMEDPSIVAVGKGIATESDGFSDEEGGGNHCDVPELEMKLPRMECGGRTGRLARMKRRHRGRRRCLR